MILNKPLLTPDDWIVTVVFSDDSIRRIGVQPSASKEKALKTAVGMIGPIDTERIKDMTIKRRNGIDSSSYRKQ